MWIVLLSLLVPLVGVALLVTDAWRQSVLPFQNRRPCAWAVQGLSAVCMILAIAIVTATFRSAIGDLAQIYLVLPLAGLLALVLIYTGIQGLRVPPTWPGADEDWDDPNVIERCSPISLLGQPEAARLRSGAWVMVLYPLLFLIPIFQLLGIFLAIFVTITVTAVVHSRRGFQCQLIWLLAIAVKNRLSIADELRQLSINRGVSLRMRLQEAAGNLESGDPLWLVLDREKLLPASTVSAIRVAEGGGRLEETLRRLAVNSTDRLRVFSISGISDVVTQVLATLTVVVAITSYLMYRIVPKLKGIFEGFDLKLPRSTETLVSVSDYFFTQGYAPVFFWIGLGMVALIWQMLLHIVGWSSLSIPILMHFFPRRDAPEILRVIAGMIREQASLPEKLRSLVDRRGRPDLGARYQRIADRIIAGETLSQALSREGVLSSSQTEAVAAAERGGHLEFVLFAMADAIEQREFRRSATWAELLKPASVLVCAGVVGFIVIAFFMPLVKMLKEYH